jgi:hypothetical protein
MFWKEKGVIPISGDDKLRRGAFGACLLNEAQHRGTTCRVAAFEISAVLNSISPPDLSIVSLSSSLFSRGVLTQKQ